MDLGMVGDRVFAEVPRRCHDALRFDDPPCRRTGSCGRRRSPTHPELASVPRATAQGREAGWPLTVRSSADQPRPDGADQRAEPIDPAVKAAGRVAPAWPSPLDVRASTPSPPCAQQLQDVTYLADDGIAGVVFLADRLGKPVLVEGPAGTGKTQLAKSVAEMTGARLIRLQCYEGLDESKALYEWNYKKQLLRIQADRQSRRRGARSTTTSSPRSSCSPGRCSRRSAPTTPSCC